MNATFNNVKNQILLNLALHLSYYQNLFPNTPSKNYF
jgi:hypothetical protein